MTHSPARTAFDRLLERLEPTLADELTLRSADLTEVAAELTEEAQRLTDFVRQGGKRVRPQFLLAGYLVAGSGRGIGTTGVPDVPADVIRAAAALELIQACALVHDDILDRSNTRRGRPSTHRAVARAHADAGWDGDSDHYGVSMAILIGDLALAWADDLFTQAATALGAWPRVATSWRAMRTEVLGGQMLDLRAAAHRDPDPAEQERVAARVNRFKTAAYTVARPVQFGAELAGGGPEVVAALREFGTAVGLAFQLRDDLLGVFGDPLTTGKPAGDDLVEGKRTVLLARATGLLRDHDPRLAADLEGSVGETHSVVTAIDLIRASGAVEVVEAEITRLENSADTALAALTDLPADAVDPSAVELLRTLATQVIRRRH